MFCVICAFVVWVFVLCLDCGWRHVINMARVKFKCRGKQDREKKVKLLELLCSNEIRIVDMFETPDVLLFENDK